MSRITRSGLSVSTRSNPSSPRFVDINSASGQRIWNATEMKLTIWGSSSIISTFHSFAGFSSPSSCLSPPSRGREKPNVDPLPTLLLTHICPP